MCFRVNRTEDGFSFLFYSRKTSRAFILCTFFSSLFFFFLFHEEFATTVSRPYGFSPPQPPSQSPTPGIASPYLFAILCALFFHPVSTALLQSRAYTDSENYNFTMAAPVNGNKFDRKSWNERDENWERGLLKVGKRARFLWCEYEQKNDGDGAGEHPPGTKKEKISPKLPRIPPPPPPPPYFHKISISNIQKFFRILFGFLYIRPNIWSGQVTKKREKVQFFFQNFNRKFGQIPHKIFRNLLVLIHTSGGLRPVSH